MKNLLTISLLGLVMSLAACGSKDNDESGVVNPSGFTDITQADLVLTSLERSLERKHDFDFTYEAGMFSGIKPPPEVSSEWEEEFFMRKDALIYASSLKALLDHKDRLSEEDERLYSELVAKTSSMAELVYSPTYDFALRSVNQIEDFQFEVEPQELIDFLGLKLYTYKKSQNGSTHAISEWKQSSEEMCLMLRILAQFDFNHLNINQTGSVVSCANHPNTKFVAEYDLDTSVGQNLDQTNTLLLGEYNEFSNSVMASAGIFLSSNSTAVGYVESTRTDYEREVSLNNSNLGPRKIRRALMNNLFENLYFKVEVLIRKNQLLGLNENEEAELYLAELALSNVDYNRIEVRLGNSPFDYVADDLEGALPDPSESFSTHDAQVNSGRVLDFTGPFTDLSPLPLPRSIEENLEELRPLPLPRSTEETLEELRPLPSPTEETSSLNEEVVSEGGAVLTSLRPKVRPQREQVTTAPNIAIETPAQAETTPSVSVEAPTAPTPRVRDEDTIEAPITQEEVIEAPEPPAALEVQEDVSEEVELNTQAPEAPTSVTEAEETIEVKVETPPVRANVVFPEVEETLDADVEEIIIPQTVQDFFAD